MILKFISINVFTVIFLSIVLYALYDKYKNRDIIPIEYKYYGFSRDPDGSFECSEGYPLGKYSTLKQCKLAALKAKPRAREGQTCSPNKLCVPGTACSDKDNKCYRLKSIGESCEKSSECDPRYSYCDTKKKICVPKNKKEVGNKYQILIKISEKLDKNVIGVNQSEDIITENGIYLRVTSRNKNSIVKGFYEIESESDKFVGSLYKAMETIPDLVIIAMKGVPPGKISDDIRNIIVSLGGSVIKYATANYVLIYDHYSGTILYEDSREDIDISGTFGTGPFI